MGRVKPWFALVLATLVAGSGCAVSPTTMDGLYYRDHAKPRSSQSNAVKPNDVKSNDVMSKAPAQTGINVWQTNYLGDLYAGDSSVVTVNQVNVVARMVFPDLDGLFRRYKKIKGQLEWDRKRRTFSVAQINVAGDLEVTDTGAFVYQQINSLMIIIEEKAPNFTGNVEQLNGILSIDASNAESVQLDQVNNVTIVMRVEEKEDYSQYTSGEEFYFRRNEPRPSSSQGSKTKNPQIPVADINALQQVNDWIIYVDNRGKPHLYQRL